MFLLRNFNFTCITFRGPALSQLLVSHVFIFAIFPKNHKIYMSEYVYMCVCVSVRVSSRVTRGRREEISPALSQNSTKSGSILEKNGVTVFIYEFIYLKCCFKYVLGKKSL